MDKLSTKGIKKRRFKRFWKRTLDSVDDFFSTTKGLDKMDKRELGYDILIFTIGFLFSRCHIIFGAHPLGLAFVCCLPTSVWSALIGAAIGALSMGMDGIIFAAVSAIAAFLRAAISVSERDGSSKGIFSEGLLLRMSMAVICGFISGAYEVMLSGLNESTLLFGISMVILPPILCFIFSGLFNSECTLRSVVMDKSISLSAIRTKENKNYSQLIFQLSFLMLVFFIGLSFRGVDIFGVSISYVFCGLTTLLTAKRFGAIRGMAVGFASSLGISGTLSVAFALAGLGAGVIFGVGNGYAILAGGGALCAYSAYAAGLSGLLATLPEYIIASTVAFPILKNIEASKKEEKTDNPKKEADDMVGTMALAYQSEYSENMDMLDVSLKSIAETVKNFCHPKQELTFSDYRDMIVGIAECHCIGCSGSGLCSAEGIRPCIKNADKIASLLLDKKRILPEDLNTDTEFCQMAKVIAESINRECARREEENIKLRIGSGFTEQYEIISKLLEGAKIADTIEKSADNKTSEELTKMIEEFGLTNGRICVFGKRRKRVIVAAEDPSGEKIASDKLRANIENVIQVNLGSPRFFRKGSMVVMECDAKRAYSVSAAYASSTRQGEEISGDSIDFFESQNDYFCAIISDGMGSGEVAKRTSEFVCNFIKSAKDISESQDSILHMINHSIRTRGEECSASVDLFQLDLINGGGTFIKSGAAPSYIKRDSSIFRIRSKTAPIGLMAGIDSEKTKAEIKSGDYIIMMSDGIADETDDAPWLLLLLGEKTAKSPKEYAQLILEEAKKNTNSKDDMSVIVIQIEGV